MKITAVKTIEIPNRGSWLTETVVANPMSIYPEYRARRSSWLGLMLQPVFVQVDTDAGITGLGQTSGGAAAAAIIEKQFKGLLVGRDPFDIEMLWDQMFRSSLPFGRKGLAVMAISAVDLALWDILGKARGEPVYRLLGGRTKERIPAYATGNDCDWYRRLGFRANKLAMPCGPADGLAGMKENEQLVRSAREVWGYDADLMIDCYMAWDVEYTVHMAEVLRPYRLRWIEEALPPDDVDGYAQLKKAIPWTAIATGEHEYTRYGFRELLQRGAADILQPDVHWVGGITEARKICALAAAHNLPVIPHSGGSVWGLHLIMATVNCPMAECVVATREGEEVEPLLLGAPEPQQGYIVPSDRPGFGVELNQAAIEALKG